MKRLLKVKLWCLIIVLLFITTLSACSETQSDNGTIVYGATMLKQGEKIYYYNQSHDNEMGMFCYNIDTGETREIDSFYYYNDLYLLDEKLYYTCAEDSAEFYVRSYDGNNTITEGIITDNLFLTTGKKVYSKDCRVFKYNNTLGIIFNNKIYIKKNDTFELLHDNITSFTIDGDKTYYSDTSGSIYVNDANENSTIITTKQIQEMTFVSKTLGNEYVITNLNKQGEYLYFLAVERNTNMGKCYRVLLDDKKIEVVNEESITSKLKFYNRTLYYFDHRSHKIMYKNNEGTNHEIEVPGNIFSFDVFDDIMYYSTINSDGKSLSYFKIIDGESKKLFN